jgi:hypothetical protein
LCKPDADRVQSGVRSHSPPPAPQYDAVARLAFC